MALEAVRSGWELFNAAGLIRTGMGEETAHDMLLINADPVVYIRHHDTEEEVHWSDVCDLPWPRPEVYGTAPPDWPYGNGC